MKFVAGFSYVEKWVDVFHSFVDMIKCFKITFLLGEHTHTKKTLTKRGKFLEDS